MSARECPASVISGCPGGVKTAGPVVDYAWRWYYQPARTGSSAGLHMDYECYSSYFERSLRLPGVELEVDARIDKIAVWLPRLDLVSLNFVVFADGCHSSQAKPLRERF